MAKKGYRKYLRSEAWKALRQQVIAREGGRCQSCNCTKTRVHVHHLTYERFGHEDLDDLQLLCEDCHHILHGGSPRRPGAFGSKKKKPKKKVPLKDQYAKLFQPWLREDRAKMGAWGIPIPPEYQGLD